MPTYYARKSGNVNATDVWATTPSGTASDVFSSFTNADTLVANSFTVTLNVNTTVKEIRNDTTGGATAGGSFTLSSVTLTADVISGTSIAATMSSGTSSIVGNVTAGTSVSAYGVSFSGGTLTVTGAVTGGSAASAAGVFASSAGTINITGTCTGGSASNAAGVYNNSTTVISVTGTSTGGSGESGVVNASTGSVAITGTCVGGASGNGATNRSTGTVTATRAKGGPLAASAAGVGGSATGSTSVEEIEFGDLGASPTNGCIRLTDKTSNVAVMYRFGTTKKNLVDANASGLMPAASNVRSGTVYNGGNSTGTCAVPAASSVAFGVPVDNTTGTAALTPAAVWDYLTSSATTAGSMGERLRNAATVASVGQALSDALSP